MTVKSLERQGHAVDAAGTGRAARQGQGRLRPRRPTSATARPAAGSTRIIDPAKTRDALILALEVATRHAEQ